MEGKSENKKGLWSVEEDKILKDYIRVHGTGKWNRIAKLSGLKRCGKSCRLRWINYLSPHVKRDDFTEEEDDLIIRLHNLLGNRWSLIAGRVPGRTDNQVKNHWNTHLSRRLGVIRKRDKTKAAATSSSQILSKEELVQNLSTSSSECNNNKAGAAGQAGEVVECGTDQSAADGLNSRQKKLKITTEDDDHYYDDDDENPYWSLSNDDDLDLEFPYNFMEFLDMSNDIVWDANPE